MAKVKLSFIKNNVYSHANVLCPHAKLRHFYGIPNLVMEHCTIRVFEGQKFKFIIKYQAVQNFRY